MRREDGFAGRLQLTFAEAEYANRKRKTRREKFPEKMEKLIPWARLEKKDCPVLR